MIIDVFPFLDEVDLAELRIKYLSNTVDAFVVSEFDHGFSGKKKEFKFLRVLDKLPQSLRRKVHYFPQEQRKFFSSPFENDRFQKDSISKILTSLFLPNDAMIFGDLDEIPNRNEIIKLRYAESSIDFFHFAQINFLGFFNVAEVSHLIQSYAGEFSRVPEKKWLGSIYTKLKTLKTSSITELRDPSNKAFSYRISNGGWHFSFCGGENTSFEERFAAKMKFTAHQEFNNEELLIKALGILKEGKDPFNRKYFKTFGPIRFVKYPRFKVFDGLTHLPKELAELCHYPKLILEK